MPDFIERQRESALRTVREALQDEIACLFNRQDRMNILRVQSGWMPVTDLNWDSILTTASFLDHPPTERGQEARENRGCLIIEIVKTHDRMTVRPGPVEIEKDYHETRAEYEERCRAIEAEGPPPPDPTLVAQHAAHCARYPWITYGLGFRRPPVEISEMPTTQAPRDPFTLTSCIKARERAKDRGHAIEPRWATSLDVMYQDVVAEIGICPPMVSKGRRVFTLDRYPKPKRGYVPGNIRWGDKSQQRDNR